ncbi:hypothetical protein [Orlajensenia leifsoniae]|uniref:Uncharacterized protein n=1 Tax=Orlajensenia leifsoniae TaxID=2561933 RepID=A0A4Y9QVY7_9MICO|nr:hypothetical protein [Leifsonia flava]TFV96704.1 hypothetical protein E4M00_11495 [Leifsonia flava]
MNEPPLDPTTAPNGSDPSDGPRMLPTIDPGSPTGRMLRDSMERLRFAPVDPAIQRFAQDVLDGRRSARDMMDLPQFQPLLEKAGQSLQEYLAAMDPAEREAFRVDIRAGRPPGTGRPDGSTGGSAGAR